MEGERVVEIVVAGDWIFRESEKAGIEFKRKFLPFSPNRHGMGGKRPYTFLDLLEKEPVS